MRLYSAGNGNNRTRLERSILERIAAGDQSAVQECMDQYGALVWSLARRWTRSAADAEDATQEIFLDIWKSAGRYAPGQGSEVVFITTIARRRLIDGLRAAGRRPQTETFDEDSRVAWNEQAPDAGELAVDVATARRALDMLEPSQRDMLLLGIVGSLSHSEIATLTGKPLGTVKTQMRRGLQKVRAMLDDGEET
jgi:RNA polymerase sigma-70 factor (ECF subfamily)